MVPKYTRLATLLLPLLLIATGCITSNEISKLEDTEFITLKTALDASVEDEDKLVDATWVPLMYMDIRGFASTEGEHDLAAYPEGYVWFDVRGIGPMFTLFARVQVKLYDDKGQNYETDEHMMILWGLFSRKVTEVMTTQGLRRESMARLLWILRWPSVGYVAGTKPTA